MYIMRSIVLALLAVLGRAAAKPSRCPAPPETVTLPNATASGYLEIGNAARLFFVFYEQQDGDGGDPTVPVTLWLQGGPGCASLFGAFYELGPELVTAELGLRPNPGAWNRRSALLFIDQPVGAGFSKSGKHHVIPADEMTLAADLYSALQCFYTRFPHLQPRPLVIAGESYAGKYVPSIGHFILQQEVAPPNTSVHHSRSRRLLTPHRPLPPHLLESRPLLADPPLFRLAGLVIGNGLTDPVKQVMALADTAFFQGYIAPNQRLRAMTMQLQTVQLITADRWEEASALRGHLLEHIRSSAGVATLLNMRRYEDYDADKLVDCYLNLPEVQQALGVPPGSLFESCSDQVAEALGPDVMKSVKDLIPDLLAAPLPVLLYQGMHDAQDGPASCEAWMYSLDWEGRDAFGQGKRHVIRARQVAAEEGSGHSSHINQTETGSSSGETGRESRSRGGRLRLPGRRQQEQQAVQGGTGDAPCDQPGSRERKAAGGKAVAYWKQGGGLTHVVLTEAGHMTPRDDPLTTRWMLETWLAESVVGGGGGSGSSSGSSGSATLVGGATA